MLETDRLRLRPISREDEAAWIDFVGDPEATRLLHSPDPFDPELGRKLLERWVRRFDDPVGMYAAIERESGETAGFVGFVKRELSANVARKLGMQIEREAEISGFATYVFVSP